MTLAQFKANFQGGYRPTLYRVTCAFPAGVADSSASDKLQFTCKAFEIPGVSTGLIEVYHMGRPIKMAGDRVYNAVQMNIIHDTDWKVRTAFERWANLINGARENVGATRLNDYAVDMAVEALDRSGNALATYTFVGAYPEDISGIQLGFDMVDQVAEFVCSISYQWVERPEAGIV